MKFKRPENLTGREPKSIDALLYYTVHKSAKITQKSFRITSKLLDSVYNQALKIKKEGMIILTIPSAKYNYILKCKIEKVQK